MKKTLQILVLTIFTNFITAQTIQDLALNPSFVNNAYSMVKVGNYIYYTNSNPSNSYAVYKFDYTSSNPTPIQVNTGVTGFSFLTGLVHHNGFLYVAANNCIWKLNLSLSNPTPEVFYYDDTATTGTYRTKNIFSLCVIGNDLYFHGTVTSPSLLSTIYKIDLTQTTPTPVTVISNLNHRIGCLVNVGNNMFISTLSGGIGIRKFDLTNTSAGVSTIINETGYLCKMTSYKNRIYYPNETTGTVKSFDPSIASPTPTLEFYISRAAGLLGVDCDLYVGTTTTTLTNRLVKVRTPFVTGNSTQTFDFSIPTDITIEDLVVTGTNITWFNSSADAIANSNPIIPNTQLVAGNTYYAVSTDGSCRSFPFAVTTAVLSNEDFFKGKLNVYPNPTQDNINIEFNEISSNVEISISNVLGQEIKNISYKNTNKITLQLPKTNGIYFVNVKTNIGSASYKIIKE